MKKISLCVVMIMVLSVMLIAQESEPSEIVGYVAYDCVEGTTGNNNFISVPLYMVDAEGDTLSSLNDLGNYFKPSPEQDPLVDAISFWVAATQSWDGISWNPDFGQWFGNPGEDNLWPMEYGNSYMISITEELTFYNVGTVPDPIQYSLVEGTTGNNNFIMVPLNRSDLTTLNALGDDISGEEELADAISFWVAATQSWDGISWNPDFGQWFGNPGEEDLWPASIGMPLMVSVTAETNWPADARADDRRRTFDGRRMR